MREESPDRNQESGKAATVTRRLPTHPGIHEGGHGEVDEDEKSDDSLEDWNSIPVLLQNVPLDTPTKII